MASCKEKIKMKPANLNHYLASLEGLSLSRHWLVGDREEAERRFASLRSVVQGEIGIEFQALELKVVEGYKRWAATYDTMVNPLLALEEEPVRRLIDASAPGYALDAACGSGRHTAYLAERGHQVSAVDISSDMLQLAASRVPDAKVYEGNLANLPFESKSFDLVVCALAISHCPDLAPPLLELARVVRLGGRLIISDFHPMLGLLGNTALFLDIEGKPAFVESYPHLCSDYLVAFNTTNLLVRTCLEPRYTREHLSILTAYLPKKSHAAIESGMLGLPGALIWDLERGANDSIDMKKKTIIYKSRNDQCFDRTRRVD